MACRFGNGVKPPSSLSPLSLGAPFLESIFVSELTRRPRPLRSALTLTGRGAAKLAGGEATVLRREIAVVKAWPAGSGGRSAVPQ